MSWLHAFIFGLLQGITEFLPISSSAHLKLAKAFCGVESSEAQVIFDLVCHLGTLVAILYFFRKDIVELLTSQRKKLLLIAIATLPLLPFYLLLKPVRDLLSEPMYLGLCLTGTAIILFIGESWRIKTSAQTLVKEMELACETPLEKEESSEILLKKMEAICQSKISNEPLEEQKIQPTPSNLVRDALCIGTMQATALIPGISRSAATISCARVLGWDIKEAVRFSFLLSIPAIIGGNCIELFKLATSTGGPIEFSASACFIGFITACATGLFVVRLAIKFLEKGNLNPFAWYCLSLGAITTVYLNFLVG